MKKLLLSAFVAISLGLNAVVLVGLASPSTVAPLTLWLQSGDDKASEHARSSSATPAESAVRPPARWTELQSDDAATLVANLRAAGYDDRAIRAILQSELDQKFIERRQELVGKPEERPWWQNPTGPYYTPPSPQVTAELQELSRKHAALLESLFGPTPDLAVTIASERRQFADLPPGKVEGLKQLLADYNQLAAAITNATAGIDTPEDRSRRQLLNEEKDRDLRAFLTPEEYDSYQLRNSPTAGSMRSNLELFQPTEDEFRKIFALQFPLDQQYGVGLGGPDPELNRQRLQAQAELPARIKAMLSPERRADYERTTDPNYRRAYTLVSLLNLPTQNATRLWQLQKDAQARMNALRYDRTISNEARNQALADLGAWTISQATEILGGQRGLDAYKVNGGEWIQNVGNPYNPGGGGGGGLPAN